MQQKLSFTPKYHHEITVDGKSCWTITAFPFIDWNRRFAELNDERVRMIEEGATIIMVDPKSDHDQMSEMLKTVRKFSE